MRFATVSLLVTVASAAVSFAAPYLPPPSSSPGRLPAFYIPPHPFLYRRSDSSSSAALGQARSQCQDIDCFISDATTRITPLVQKLAYITPENCTVDDLTPTIFDMIFIFDVTISGMTEALSGKTLEDILTTADDVVLTTDDVAQLVADLITLISGGMSVVVNLSVSVGGNLNNILLNIAGVLLGLTASLVSLPPSILNSISTELAKSLDASGAISFLTGSSTVASAVAL